VGLIPSVTQTKGNEKREGGEREIKPTTGEKNYSESARKKHDLSANGARYSTKDRKKEKGKRHQKTAGSLQSAQVKEALTSKPYSGIYEKLTIGVRENKRS